MITVNQYFSKKITLISFIMSIFVVYIHSNNLVNVGLAEEITSIDYIATRIIVECFARIAVPFFFMMSGYWFFRFDFSDIKGDLTTIKSKLLKKVKSLVVPYLIWNTFVYLFFIVITRIPFVFNLMNMDDAVGVDFKSIIFNVFLHEQNYPMWYVQNLLVLLLLTPLFLLMLKNKYISLVTLTMLGVLYCMGFSWDYCQTSSIFFFLLGAIIAVYYRKFFEERSNKKIALIASGILVFRIVSAYFEFPVLSTVALLFSPVALVKFFDVFNDFKVNWFTKQSFFVYCAHLLPTTIVMKILAKLFGGNDLLACLAFMVTPFVTLIGLYIVAKIMIRFMPKLYGLLCGGRS